MEPGHSRSPAKVDGPTRPGHEAASAVAGQRLDLVVRARDIELRCSSIGVGPTVVLLHAGGERRQVWRPVADRLAACGVRAISVDQRGHGETAGPLGTGLDVYADDVADLIRAFGVPVVLAGCSLGGLAALLATADPDVRERVVGLVLIDVVPDPDPVRARRHLAAAEAERAAGWEWSLIDDILDRSAELREAATSLRCPITLVRGTSSWAIDADDQLRFAALVGHATLVEIEGAGHLVARHRPRELAAALLDHVGRSSDPSLCGDPPA